MQRRVEGDEEGSALVLALVFFSVLGVFIGAVLSFGSSSLRRTVAVREQRDVVYASDGAVEGAINAIRGNVAFGKEGGSCPNFVAPFHEADSSRTKTVTVTCAGLAGSGATTGGTSNSANMPAQAVLTLAETGTNGFVQGSNNELRIGGNVLSNSNVHVPVAGATLTVDGTVTAKEGCTGNGTVTPSCTADPDADVDDPGYAKRSDAPATPGPYQDLSTQQAQCTAANSTVTFSPGLYTDAVALSELTSEGGSCPNSLFWFQPGVYYFDFVNSGSHEWTVSGSGTNVVGGEANGWTPGSPRPTVALPGGCKTADDGGTDGVQFVFGGDSHVLVEDAKVELCAKPTETEQQIALYGVPSGNTPAAVTATQSPTTNPANSSPGFSPPSNAYAIGETPTTATADFGLTDPEENTTGSITLAGVGLGTIPAGSTITSVKARIAHQASNVDSLRLTISSSGGSTVVNNGPCTNATKLCLNGSSQVLDTDVTSLFPTTTTLSTASFKVEATIKKKTTGTEKLDGVALLVTYVAPAYRALSSAVTVLTTRGSPAAVSIVGTLYAPTAGLDIQLTNISAQVVRRGVIARTVRVEVTGSSEFTGNAIELPSGSSSPPADREVLFTAQIDGTTRLRAVAAFADGGGATPGQTVTIQEWSVQR